VVVVIAFVAFLENKVFFKQFVLVLISYVFHPLHCAAYILSDTALETGEKDPFHYI
jgi:hypothetical protein